MAATSSMDRWVIAMLGQVDEARRRTGYALDQLGLGIAETPSRVAWSGAGLRLRAYQDRAGEAPVLLIVPAPIKRGYIWDLAPNASVVARCLHAGLQVYLIDWQRPSDAQQDWGLAEYADRSISDCLDGIEKESGQKRVFLAGHSLGGTLAAIYAALHPERVRGLILVGAPLHFSPEIGALEWLVSGSPRAQTLTPLMGNVPGTFLNLAAYAASPATFEISRALDWVCSLMDPQAMRLHVRVERWTLDESPMARRLFEQMVEWLYREDRFMRRRLMIGGHPAAPEAVTAPILAVVDRRSAVVPAQSVLPFLQAASSKEKQVLWYEGDTGVALQHVGALVGRSAHQSLWPGIVQWMQTH